MNWIKGSIQNVVKATKYIKYLDKLSEYENVLSITTKMMILVQV